MIAGPRSLRGRVTFTGVAVVAVLVVALDVFVYLSLRGQMFSSLDRVLDARAQLVIGLAEEELRPQALSSRLNEVGLPAIVRTPEGDEYLSGGATPFETIPAGGRRGEPEATRTVPLPGGGEVVVLASRGGIDATLRRLLLLEAVGTAAVIALAHVALTRLSARILRPVRDVGRTARSIAAGSLDRRLGSQGDDDELAEMATAFNDMLDALEEALERSRASEEASRRFLADAAHQLRNPAAGIRASVATLLRSHDAAERDRLLDNLARESARMSRLLSSLLRVARLDRGERPTLRPTPIDDLTAGLVEGHRARAPSLRFEVDVTGPATADVDPTAVEEALANLLDNAIRHASDVVRIEVGGDEGLVRVVVRDDGPGVAPHDRDRIFDRFVSLDDDGGSGLGLPIARGIARSHGGDLDYQDGAFVLQLPRGR